jgi:hypothetical protein
VNTPEDRTQPDFKLEAGRSLAELRRGKYRLRPYTLPESNGCPPIPMRLALLSCDEVQECHAQALAQLRNDRGLDPTDLVNAQTLEDETLTQILYRALRMPAPSSEALQLGAKDDPTVTLHPDANDCRKCYTPDERALLADEYNDFRAMVDPDPRLMPPELVLEIRAAVKKKDEPRLSAFGGRKLALYLLSTDSQPASSPTGSFES